MYSVRRAFVPSVWMIVGVISGCGNQRLSDSADASLNPGKDIPHIESHLGPLTKTSVQGTVVSAFQIWVDGKSYADSEDFYSQELGRLGEKITAAGYSGWQADFEAVLGFKDLSSGMTVFVAPVGDRGPAGQAQVSLEGNFRVELPASADSADLKYNIRAVKRVNIVLIRGEEKRRFCYNFSAIEKNVALSSSSVTMIQLDTFETHLTAYACDSQQDGKAGTAAVPIPFLTPAHATNKAVRLPDPVTLGETAEAVVGKFGDPEKISRVTSLSSSYRAGYDFYWAYLKLPGNFENLQCLFYFGNQSLIAYDRCPAVLVDFGADRANAAAKPSARVASGDSPVGVLSKWGMPTFVSLSIDGLEQTWEFASTTLSTGSCGLKFKYESLQQYTGNCKLNWVAHWTF